MKQPKRYITFVVMMLLVLTSNAGSFRVVSPDGRIELDFWLEAGKPFYALSMEGRRVLSQSSLGYKLSKEDWTQNLLLKNYKESTMDYKWYQPWGEEDSVRCHYNELMVQLSRPESAHRMDIYFRVFNEGAGIRYVFHGSTPKDSIIVISEETQFSLAHDAEAWSIPAHPENFYEHEFEASLVSKKDTVCTPLTIHFEKDIYMALHEAALLDYAKMNLTVKDFCLQSDLSPWSDGTKVKAEGEMKSPWRVIMLAKSAGKLVTNRVMLNLNEPSRITNTSWIEPGKYIGIWWSIHKKKHTWEAGPSHGATTDEVKRYIDFAARHGFSGVLSEGWNIGWGKGEQLTFKQSYPDFDLEEVTRYARQKGVRWIAHAETWGNARLLENEMDSVFRRWSLLGINTVKTGYVGQLMDGKELPSSQYGIRHYQRVIECAARHHLMVDNHEPAMPTGLQRTYPNLMTQEAVRGQEYNAWDRKGGNTPAHTAVLPFTRCLAGPVDFTPVIFDYSEIVPGTHPHSTIAKQLAEFVVLYSPLQMAADEIEHYEDNPAFAFVEACPTNWSKTIVANGEIGKYITTCRKVRGGDDWFVGSLTNEEARTITLPLDFLDSKATYRAIIYEDGDGADHVNNPGAINIREEIVNSATILQLKLSRSGGVAMHISKY